MGRRERRPGRYALRERLKWLAVRVGHPLGIDVPRRHVPTSLAGLVTCLREQGFDPPACVDVGVAWGTTELQDGFPASRHVLVEPNPRFAPYLRSLAERRGHELVEKALSDSHGRVAFVSEGVHEQGGHVQRIGVDAPLADRFVEATTLDRLVGDLDIPQGFLLKIDVEGHEAAVIRGAQRTMGMAEVVVVETSPTGRATSTDVVRAMASHGHLLTGFLTPWVESRSWRRLASVDLVFFRAGSPLLAGEDVGRVRLAQRTTPMALPPQVLARDRSGSRAA